MQKIIPRIILKILKKTAKHFPVLMVTGPRQIGKTTLLALAAKKTMRYVSLDSLQTRILAQQEPELFLEKYPPPVIIDEVQYAPELFPYIKISVDTSRKNGQFWLTGSQQFHLMKNVTESLAGRVGILPMLGLSNAEHEERELPPFIPTKTWLKSAEKSPKPMSTSQYYQRIWRGSFPALALNPSNSWDVFYHSYIETYIERDVQALANVVQKTSFLKFLRAAAVRTGQLLNFADLARDADIDFKTAKSWLSILEASGLIYLLPSYHNNQSKRLVKTPKLYFLDTGLVCYLAEWSSAKTLEAGAMSGAILETFLFAEIIKSYLNQGKQGRFYFYRDKNLKEIDLLIERDGKLHPIEFKKTSNPHASMLAHAENIAHKNIQIGEGAIICFVKDQIPLAKNITAIPVWFL